jgi:predicted Rossmann fold nucleotide-binding protein DprA/Smf involved in DNA uptake
MTKSFPEPASWLALAYASGLKLARVKTMVGAWCLEGGQPLSALLELPAGKMAARLGLSAEEAGRVAAAAGRVPEQAAWLVRLEGDGVQLVTRADPRYPPALTRWLPPALQPLLLFCRGEVGLLNQLAAAVVGAQDARAETVDFARELATLLAEEGLVVVGGLERGVGQAAFDGTLAAGGQTVAILPMGIGAFSVPPAAGQDGALLVSPFHPDAKFDEAQALARYKLIAGLAEAIFAVGAGETGGARQAADEALQQGKAVYVWDVDPAAEPAAAGHPALVEAGALPITGVPDILDALEAIVAATLEPAGEDEPRVMEPPVTQGTEQGQEEEGDVETPFDAQAALDLLSKAGRVPEALRKRLKGLP